MLNGNELNNQHVDFLKILEYGIARHLNKEIARLGGINFTKFCPDQETGFTRAVYHKEGELIVQKSDPIIVSGKNLEGEIFSYRVTLPINSPAGLLDAGIEHSVFSLRVSEQRALDDLLYPSEYRPFVSRISENESYVPDRREVEYISDIKSINTHLQELISRMKKEGIKPEAVFYPPLLDLGHDDLYAVLENNMLAYRYNYEILDDGVVNASYIKLNVA